MRKSSATKNSETDLKTILAKNPILLDVRTHTEFVGYHLPNARNISMREIPYCLEEIKSWDQSIVVYSTNGFRSRLVFQILKQAGISVFNAGSQSRVAALINLT